MNIFSLKFISLDQWRILYDLWSAFLIFQVLLGGLLSKSKSKFFYEIIGLILIPILSLVPAYFYHEQGVGDSLLASRPVLLLLFFFYVCKSSIDPEIIQKILFYFGVAVAIIYIIQYVSYPTTWFQQLREQDDFDERGGIKRIFIQDPIYIIFSLLIIAKRFTERVKLADVVIFLVLVVGAFLTGIRQTIFIGLGALLLFFISSLNFKQKFAYRFLAGLAFAIGGFFYLGGPVYVENLVTLTTEQKSEGSDYIRLREADYFMNSYMPSSGAYVIGNGITYGDSKYGKEVSKAESDDGFYRSDVGLIGALNMFGAIYLIPIAFIFIKVFFSKWKWGKEYKFFFLFLLFTSFTGEIYFFIPCSFTIIYLSIYILEKKNEPIQLLAIQQE